jgi:hypothetical protein
MQTDESSNLNQNPIKLLHSKKEAAMMLNCSASTIHSGRKTLQMVVRYSHLSQSHELAAVEKICAAQQLAATAEPNETSRIYATGAN